MNKENENDTYLSIGEGSYKDFIVGDEKGIKNLLQACQEAIDSGESTQNDLGSELKGIKVVKNPQEGKELKISLFNRIISFLFVSTLGVSFIVGLVTIVKWIVSLLK